MSFLGDVRIDWLPLPPLLLAVGFLLLAVALRWYSRVLGELLEELAKPPVEVLVVIAAWVIILAFVIPQYVASAVFAANLGADARMGVYLLTFRSVSFFGLLIAALLVLMPSLAYYSWVKQEAAGRSG